MAALSAPPLMYLTSFKALMKATQTSRKFQSNQIYLEKVCAEMFSTILLGDGQFEPILLPLNFVGACTSGRIFVVLAVVDLKS